MHRRAAPRLAIAARFGFGLAAWMAAAQPAAAEDVFDPVKPGVPAALQLTSLTAAPKVEVRAPQPKVANFRAEPASADARRVADWVVQSADNHWLPFVIIDKREAKVLVFDAQGQLVGAAAALLGMGHGDDSIPGIGHRRLASISVEERTTPSGRFTAALGQDLEHDVLWIDYEIALSLHRVITGKPAERRFERLASPSIADNRISYGCINVPIAFYEKVVIPTFADTTGVVYILPETKRVDQVFAMTEIPGQGPEKASPEFQPGRK